MDTARPIDITEEEELERITGMLQRDNLVRGVGIVEEVYKLLHCTAGTGGPRKDCVHYSVGFLWLLF
jgi:tubulin polyglutamylase TTLL6/13